MGNIEICEKDWKLFRSKIGQWQEAYIEKLNQQYIEILNAPACASERFWKLEKRIACDKKKTGVIVEMNRRNMLNALLSLLNENIIVFGDLAEFSDDTKDKLKNYFS